MLNNFNLIINSFYNTVRIAIFKRVIIDNGFGCKKFPISKLTYLEYLLIFVFFVCIINTLSKV